MSELAVDLGSATLRVWGSGGELMREPAVASSGRVRRGWGRARRVLGRQALELARGEQALALVRPITEGVLTDPDVAETLLRAGLAAGGRRLLSRPRICFTISATLGDLQRRALRALAQDSGARGARAVVSPLAVLAGLGVDVRAPVGHMVIDVGGGTTQVAVVALGSVVVSRGLARGGEHMDRALEQYLEQRFRVGVGPGEAERLRMQLGGAQPAAPGPLRVPVRDLGSGAPRELELHGAELYAALAPVLDEISRLAREVLAQTPPELASDIADAGLVLCGGASQLAGLDQRLREATGVPVKRVPDAVGAAARGCAALLSAPRPLQELLTPL